MTGFVVAVLAGCDSGIDSDIITDDSKTGTEAGALDWEGAISFCEDLKFAGYTDWRLPNIKELQSIVDYTRSPDATGTAAIDPAFNSTEITNEGGEIDYPYYWSSTTHISGKKTYKWATYVAFGRALGYMDDTWKDVHGAGAQRSDPKADDGTDYSSGFGPQGDAIRTENYARCVRDDSTVTTPTHIIVDTNQVVSTTTTTGEDSDYDGVQPSYTLNDYETIVTDNNTGLMWQRTMAAKMSYSAGVSGASDVALGGYTDWRLPTVKELYSLILFSGEDATSCTGTDDECTTEKFIDTDYFDQPYGETDDGYRVIDAQTWTSTEYVSTTMDGDETTFGVNFVDGRIKGYPVTKASGADNLLYVRYVRGNSDYENASYTDNSDETVTDNATGLMWAQNDSGTLESAN